MTVVTKETSVLFSSLLSSRIVVLAMLISVYFMRSLPPMGKRTLAKDTSPQRVTIESTRCWQLDLSMQQRALQVAPCYNLRGERRDQMLGFDT